MNCNSTSTVRVCTRRLREAGGSWTFQRQTRFSSCTSGLPTLLSASRATEETSGTTTKPSNQTLNMAQGTPIKPVNKTEETSGTTTKSTPPRTLNKASFKPLEALNKASFKPLRTLNKASFQPLRPTSKTQNTRQLHCGRYVSSCCHYWASCCANERTFAERCTCCAMTSGPVAATRKELRREMSKKCPDVFTKLGKKAME